MCKKKTPQFFTIFFCVMFVNLKRYFDIFKLNIEEFIKKSYFRKSNPKSKLMKKK